MKFDFDQHHQRRGTDCYNYDGHPGDPDGEVMPLLAADMDFQTLPEVVEALDRVIRRGIYGYAIDPPEYAGTVCGWFERRHGWTPEQDWLVSCRNVVSATARLIGIWTKPGDAVMTFTPVYSPFFGVIRQNGRRVVDCPLTLRGGRYEIDFEDFERKIVQNDVRLLLLCSPHNPVGRVWTRDELSRVAAICRQNGVFVIADEIHCDFVFPGHRHTPFLSLPEADLARSAACTSANKTFNLAMLENANIFIPDRAARGEFQKEQTASYVEGGSYLGKLACATAYRYGAQWTDELVAYLDGNLAMAHRLISSGLPELSCAKPEGTYLLWVDMGRLSMDDDELSRFLLHRARLRLVSGKGYGAGRPGFVRINCARPRDELQAALERLKTAVETR